MMWRSDRVSQRMRLVPVGLDAEPVGGDSGDFKAMPHSRFGRK
jgi:hypothetical protein